MGLHTRVCELLGIEYPILLAGMGDASTPKLAAAVSNAGGLGILGAAACTPDRLREWIREVRSLTDKPFGVDTLLPASVRRANYTAQGQGPREKVPEYKDFARAFMQAEGLEREKRKAPDSGTSASDRQSSGQGSLLFSKEFFESQMEVVIEERVPVYAAGLGNPGPWMDRLHANGTKVLAVVGAVRHAVQVANSGIDLIVAQGHDGGGHNSPIGTMALIPQVVDALGGRIPVLGAGGIADGRGIAAAMMLGAEGAWIGTAFLVSEEAGIQPFQKEAIVEGTDESTTVSRSVTGKPARLIKNKWTEAWTHNGLEPLPMPYQLLVSMPVLNAAAATGRKDIVPGFAGQGLGMIKAVRPAAEILRDLVQGAETALGRAGAFVAPQAAEAASGRSPAL